MVVKSKSFPAPAGALPDVQIRLRAIPFEDSFRRKLVWAQVILAFLFLECAVWAARLSVRSRWAIAAGAIILIFVLADRPSVRRLGLGLPNAMASGLTLGIGFACAGSLVLMAHWSGGPVPANPLFPNMHMAWQYVIWAMVQEFILQAFFYTRLEELFGSQTAVWVTATFFAVVHLPNMILMTFTLIVGLFFCEMFRRYRSIYLLGFVHALLGLTLSATVPSDLLHHLRVGIGYFK
jgi:membrane protease YdiL (CAAX protease family)